MPGSDDEQVTDEELIDPDGPAEGPPLSDEQELLWRQALPAWVHDDVPTSQVFRPTTKDRKRLSTARTTLISAHEAYERHVATGFATQGTWAISVGEAEAAGVPAHADGGLRGLPADHASLYFGGKSRSQMESAAKRLRHAALQHGRQYP
jgi:hypothetical protein